MSEVCAQLVIGELAAKLHAAGIRLAGQQLREADGKFLHDIQRIVSGQPGIKLRENLADLNCQLRGLAAGIGAEDAISPAAAMVIREFSAYVEFLATLLDVFTMQLSRDRIIAASSPASGEASFDQLCRIRQTLRTSTDQAMLALSAFRAAWGLSCIADGEQSAARPLAGNE
jgi:hypothetical protein